ncbi:MAG: flagellar export protein FliJ [Bacillus sp. (in: firmicutes)]
MTFQYKFDKILGLKEKEKQDVYVKYSESIKKFEEVAEKLYNFLKKKENLLNEQQVKLQEGLSVHEIRHQQYFMDNLEQMISHYQQEVMFAREKMNKWQHVLIEKNIEVKKYEKIREKEYDKFSEQYKLFEKNQMDDISIQTYLSKGN